MEFRAEDLIMLANSVDATIEHLQEPWSIRSGVLYLSDFDYEVTLIKDAKGWIVDIQPKEEAGDEDAQRADQTSTQVLPVSDGPKGEGQS